MSTPANSTSIHMSLMVWLAESGHPGEPRWAVGLARWTVNHRHTLCSMLGPQMLLRRLPLGRHISSLSQKLPTRIPDSASVQLPRSVIAVFGKDSAKFLNGLITIRPPEPRPDVARADGVGAYAAMLNSRGRVLADMFVYPAHDNAEIQSAAGSQGLSCFLLEVDNSVLDLVLNTLDFHVLLSNVEIKVLDSYKVWSAWDDKVDIDRELLSSTGVWTEDLRAPGMGVRHIREDGTQSGTVLDYDLRRYLFGVPEGSSEIIPNKALPLEYCMDYMGGIDFNKGCYLGQELTIRTHHHGSVNKRVAPVVFTQSPDDDLPEELYKPTDFGINVGADITDDSPVPNSAIVNGIFGESPFGASSKGSSRQRPSGQVIASLGNVGLAKLRVDTLGHDFRINDLYVKPLIPFWWP